MMCDNMKIFVCEYGRMPKVSVEIPQELLDDLDEHVGDEESLWSLDLDMDLFSPEYSV